MSELETNAKLYFKMRPLRSDIRIIQGFAVRAGLTDLYHWCDRAMQIIIRRERSRYAAYKVCLHEVKQQPHTPSADYLAFKQKREAFFAYYHNLPIEQSQRFAEQASPELTTQMHAMHTEREQLPLRIIDLWQLGQQNEAKQAIYRYYRLGRDWQDLHNQRYQMVMDRFLALRETTTTN
jgi:hypothetical protein